MKCKINKFLVSDMLLNVTTDTYSYIEGSHALFCGRLGMRKLRIPDIISIHLRYYRFDIVLNSYAFNRWMLSEKIKAQLIRPYISRYYKILEIFFRELVYSVTFGYIYKFKFESRLYRARYQYTSFIFRLGIAHKVNYCLPLNLRVKENDRRHLKDYYTIYGMSKRDVIHTAYLFRSFRVPDMYSRLGIFVKSQPVEFREGIKRMRV